jgi:aminocarboxymuconate-semialdehyde decarboxylase
MAVIDTQCHWHARSYFEALARRKRAPRAEPLEGGYRIWITDDVSSDIPSLACDIEPQVAELQAAGIDVLLTSMGAYGVDRLPADEALELAMAVNEERVAAEKAYPGQVYTLALIPMQDAAAGIAALDHAVRNLGMRGVCILSNIAGESIATEGRRPIFARAQELDVPVFIHPTHTVMEDRIRRYGHEFTIAYMVDSSFAALDLIFSGFLDDLPRLQVVQPHVGGVLPYLAARIDYEYSKPWAYGRELPRPPSEYLRRLYTDTVNRNPGSLQLAHRAYGADRILFATDYPYWTPVGEADFVRASIGAAEADLVLGGNATALLKLA